MDRIRLHRAADLRELGILLRMVQAPVVLADAHFPGGEWRDALRYLAERRLEVPLVVAAPTITSALWREVLLAGGFGLVKRPFAAGDLTVALDSASRYLHTVHEMIPLRTA